MRVIATNIAKPTSFIWEGTERKTGIFKYPTKDPIYLDEEGVVGDTIGNPKVHGGEYKACYLFSEEEYDYWKKLYPDLDWQWGMFGENLTVSGLDEGSMRVGDLYQVGQCLVEVTQPREPCFKLGYRFKDQQIIEKFIAREKPGTYVRVLQTGLVSKGDTIRLHRRSESPLTVLQLFRLIYAREKNKKQLQWATEHHALPARFRNNLNRGQ